jgi:hypothetical protein
VITRPSGLSTKLTIPKGPLTPVALIELIVAVTVAAPTVRVPTKTRPNQKKACQKQTRGCSWVQAKMHGETPVLLDRASLLPNIRQRSLRLKRFIDVRPPLRIDADYSCSSAAVSRKRRTGTAQDVTLQIIWRRTLSAIWRSDLDFLSAESGSAPRQEQFRVDPLETGLSS